MFKIFINLFFIFLFAGCTKVTDADISQGKIALSGLHETNVVCRLNGEWIIANSGNVTYSVKTGAAVPGLINYNTMGSRVFYSLHITGLDDKEYILKFRRVLTAYKVTINGKEMNETGVVSDNIKDAQPGFANTLILFRPESGNALIEIEVSNFHDPRGTGLFETPYIGTLKAITNYKIELLFYDIFFATMLLVVGLYHLITFLSRKNEKQIVYFGLLLIINGLREFMTGERVFLDLFRDLSWTILYKTEILTVYIIAVAITLFMNEIISNKIFRKLSGYFVFFTILTILVHIILPAPYFIKLLTWFYVPVFCMIIIGILTAFSCYRSTDTQKILFMIGLVAYSFSLIFDMLYFLGLLRNGHFSTFGLTIFMLIESWYLLRTLTGKIHSSEKYALIMNKTQNEQFQINSRLDEILKKRTKQLDTLLLENESMKEQINELKNHSLPTILATGIIEEIKEYSTQISEIIKNNRTEVTDALPVALKLNSITSQLTSFLKPSDPVIAKIPLNSLLIRVAEKEMSLKGYEYNLHLPDSLLYSEADESDITTILHNVLENAIEASFDNKYIDIFLSQAEIDTIMYNVISVRDYGQGISEDASNKIFDPFFTTKKNSKGLGLSTALSILRKYKGTLHYENESGSGCTMHIQIPQCESGSVLNRETVDTHETYVLVIDDENEILNLLKRMVISLGYIPLTASNGDDAIKLYSQYFNAGKKILFVIVDLILPGQFDGKKIMASLLDINPNSIGILSTGVSNDPSIDNPQQFGFKAVLKKPYSITEFNDMIKTVVLK